MDLAIAFFADEDTQEPVASPLKASALDAAKHLARGQFNRFQVQYGATIARVIDLDAKEVLYVYPET